MKVAFFSAHHFERDFFIRANSETQHDIVFFDSALNVQTAGLAEGFGCVCCFVTDELNFATLESLSKLGIKLLALRSAGFNHVDLKAAEQFGISVVRVPSYSPHAVAEYTVGLLLSLNRKIHKAYARVRELNFSLEGLMGFDLHRKVVGIVGTGKIGAVFAKIMNGFGCEVIAYDLRENSELVENGVLKYVSLAELYDRSDIISLHAPLVPETRHMISTEAFQRMKPGAILLNTGRGALIDTFALIDALKLGRLGGAGLDVYEEEEGIFFNDLSDHGLRDDQLARLLTFPNVLLTSHQAFFTKEALEEIARVSLMNITEFSSGKKLSNPVHAKTHIRTL